MPIQTVLVTVVPGHVTVHDRLTGSISVVNAWFWQPAKVGLEGSQSHFTATDDSVYQRLQSSLMPGALSQVAVTDCASAVAGFISGPPAVTAKAITIATTGHVKRAE